jgi:hypothetical protein
MYYPCTCLDGHTEITKIGVRIVDITADTRTKHASNGSLECYYYITSGVYEFPVVLTVKSEYFLKQHLWRRPNVFPVRYELSLYTYIMFRTVLTINTGTRKVL